MVATQRQMSALRSAPAVPCKACAGLRSALGMTRVLARGGASPEQRAALGAHVRRLRIAADQRREAAALARHAPGAERAAAFAARARAWRGPQRPRALRAAPRAPAAPGPDTAARALPPAALRRSASMDCEGTAEPGRSREATLSADLRGTLGGAGGAADARPPGLKARWSTGHVQDVREAGPSQPGPARLATNGASRPVEGGRRAARAGRPSGALAPREVVVTLSELARRRRGVEPPALPQTHAWDPGVAPANGPAPPCFGQAAAPGPPPQAPPQQGSAPPAWSGLAGADREEPAGGAPGACTPLVAGGMRAAGNLPADSMALHVRPDDVDVGPAAERGGTGEAARRGAARGGVGRKVASRWRAFLTDEPDRFMLHAGTNLAVAAGLAALLGLFIALAVVDSAPDQAARCAPNRKVKPMSNHTRGTAAKQYVRSKPESLEQTGS